MQIYTVDEIHNYLQVECVKSLLMSVKFFVTCCCTMCKHSVIYLWIQAMQFWQCSYSNSLIVLAMMVLAGFPLIWKVGYRTSHWTFFITWWLI